MERAEQVGTMYRTKEIDYSKGKVSPYLWVTDGSVLNDLPLG